MNFSILLIVDKAGQRTFLFRFWEGGGGILLKSISITYLEPIKTSQLSVKGELKSNILIIQMEVI